MKRLAAQSCPHALPSVGISWVLAALAILLFTAPQNLWGYARYWDPDANVTGNTTAGANLGGTGTWSTGTANWWSGAAPGSEVVWDNTARTPRDDAMIWNAGTITMGSGITARSVRLLGGSGNVTLGGTQTLTMYSGNTSHVDISAATNYTLTINPSVTIAGTERLYICEYTQGGKVVYTGPGTYSGGLTIWHGTFEFNGDVNAVNNPCGAYPSTFDPDNIILTVNAVLRSTKTGAGSSLVKVNRGITVTGWSTIDIADATPGNFLIYGGVIAMGANDLVKAGPGTLALYGTTTGTKTIEIHEGTLRIRTSSERISDDQRVYLKHSGTLFDVAGYTETIGSLAGEIGSVVDIRGANATSAGTLRVNRDNTGTIMAGVIQGAGSTLVKQGTSFLRLAGPLPNTYSGAATIIEDGELMLDKDNGVTAIPMNVTLGDGVGTDQLSLWSHNQIADTSVVTIAGPSSGNSGKFNLGGYNETIEGVSASESFAVIQNAEAPATALGTSTLTVSNAGDYTFAGIIRDHASGAASPLALAKEDAGTFTLTGADNTYSGTTAVKAGTLTLDNGSIGTGTATVEAGAILRGKGTMGGNLTVKSGGLLAPGLLAAGQQYGTLTDLNSGNVTLEAGSLTGVDIDRAYAHDQVAGIGTMTEGGTLYVTNRGATLQANDQWPLFVAASYSGTPFAAIDPAMPVAGEPDLVWDRELLRTNGILRVHHVPFATNLVVLRSTNTTWKIPVSKLFPNPDPLDGETVVMASFEKVSSNGGRLESYPTHPGLLFYYPANNNNDTFNYTVVDTRGESRSKTIQVVKGDWYGQPQTPTVPPSGPVTVRFQGVPGLAYEAQRATVADFSGTIRSWFFTPAMNPTGQFEISDDFSDLGGRPSQAYYRLKYNQ
ncbi:MAG TPA: autotransporter-associated beta strand repeat-containing protein [Verrucomicrobiota bacterium]|nr:autotransporter-associated beta strand repeat-containing protein [Verrucomicrobiota bacterium]HQL77327.1 autotransporter-associated beta strand repeat-containing protein [Verrucomicrobiota bacterium]